MRSVELNGAQWRKSSYSNQDGGACVEVATNQSHAVPVRDSKDRCGPVLVVPSVGWSSFVSAVRAGGLSA
ncbi:DUF397 domain-containing protein [Streptomyces avicenniae]|uniref:DUF397 domain-containing protein n=1 Tax=Streptomyces avicenniae TaxID=500153 RepID=UPI000DA60318|nr:DUF397 domain-containing protein [Streptomyces avicenniae]